MIEPRDFEPRESILRAARRVTRPRVPLRFGDQGRPGLQQRAPKRPVVGLPRRGLGNLRRGRKSWFPNRNTAARSATAPSSLDARTLPRPPTRPLLSPEARRSRSGYSSVPVSADLSEAKRLAFRAPRACAPEQTRTRLRRNPVYSGTRCREPPSAAAH